MADTDQVLNLAAIIRKVDGNHSKGAAALAESILDHPRFRAVLAGEPAVPGGREPAAVTGQPNWRGLCEELVDAWLKGDDIVSAMNRARDVLARWGNHVPAPPADGEVAELVAWLQEEADDYEYECIGCEDSAARCNRAAELLQRLSPPQPVPVSERLPGPEDCDANGRCWWGRSESHDWSADWTFATYKAVAEFCEFSPRTTWLPAHALPLPKVGA